MEVEGFADSMELLVQPDRNDIDAEAENATAEEAGLTGLFNVFGIATPANTALK